MHGLSTDRMKRQNPLVQTFVQQLEIFSRQAGYWFSVWFGYGDVEVNEPLSFIEHGYGSLLNLSGGFGVSAAVLRVEDGAEEEGDFQIVDSRAGRCFMAGFRYEVCRFHFDVAAYQHAERL